MVAVAAPEREQRGREARVADRADVRAAVAEADDRVRVGEHLADRVEVAVGVVEERQVEERPPVVASSRSYARSSGSRPSRSARRGDARRGVGLVVGRVAELEHARERSAATPRAVGRGRGPRRAGAGLERRVDRWRRPARRAAASAISRYTGLREQRVQRALQPEQQPDGRGATCAGHRDAVGVRLRRAARAGGASRRRAPARARTTAAGPTPRPCAGRSRTRRRRRRSRTRPAARPGRSRRSRCAMPTSSSASAVSVGVNSPLLVRWFSVRDVVNPSAPASMPSRASVAIARCRRRSRPRAARRARPSRAAAARRAAPARATSTSNGPAVERVHELGERLPVPREALVQHRAGDVLDAFHQLDEPVVVGRVAPARSRRRSCRRPRW